MRRTKWAAAAIAVIALGTVGCGTSDTGIGVAATTAPPSPRPQGTGPLTKDVVRADLDTSVADSGVPANDPYYARTPDRAPAGSRLSCSVTYKGFGTESTPVDLAHYDGLVGELRERDWRQSGDRRERKDADGVIGVVSAVLKQRGWTMAAEYRITATGGVITLVAFDDACVKKNAAGTGPLG
ncbi:hypothetical protein ACIGEZ_32040 [Streptomyces sp. NPDC085481]|uniref:hypothetical protein n=1 Tax=Streptomyces sp. NPDC085481 TaxID=3365727 RepID=UPI0037D77BF8